MERRVLGNVGACIYCGAGGGLTKEHVIASALGGRDELHSASCGKCQSTTSLIERRIAQSDAWWPLRRALVLKSRRPKGQPDAFRAKDKSVSPPREVSLSVDEYPLFVPFFLFDPPGLLNGARPEADAAGRVTLWMPRRPTNRVPLELSMAGFSAADFARMIAKIALGYAIATYKPSAFAEIYVTKLIHGDLLGVNLWVGCMEANPIFAEGRVHAARVQRDRDQVSVILQLFRAPTAFAQTPVYHVFVGRLKDDAR
jgi:hypothetical protein